MTFSQKLMEMIDMLKTGRKIVQFRIPIFIVSLLLLIPSMIVSYIVYWFRYRGFRRIVKEHIANLKQLNAFYQKEDEKKTAE